MRKIPLLTLAALAVALLVQGPARATTLPYKGLDRLVAEADGVVLATVRDVQSTEEGQKDIETYVTFDELQMLGGQHADPTLTLRMKGGRVGGRILYVPGTPDFQPGERVLMFVQGNGHDLVPLVGWTQGLFRLTTDAGGAPRVSDSNGHAVTGIEGNQVLVDEDRGETEEHVHILGAPDADVARHAAAAGRSGGGLTDDGSPTTLVGATLVQSPMPADSFLSAVKKRIAQRTSSHVPFAKLASVTPGMSAQADTRDQASGDTRANEATRAAPESPEPHLPAARELPDAPR